VLSERGGGTKPAGGLAPITADDVKREAVKLGFDLCGIAPAAAHVELAFLREWLDRGYAADMQYMHRTADRRADVRRVLPSARVVISLGTIYNVDRPYSTEHDDPGRAALARYAWGDDYHTVIQRRLDALLAWLGQSSDGFEGRAYVDTGPVQERVYAQYAGLGWIGKNTCLINPDAGTCRSSSIRRCSTSAAAALCASPPVQPVRWSNRECSIPAAAFRT
jgi:epoxyqueuosine reductase